MNQPTIKQLLTMHPTSANNLITADTIVHFCLIINNIGQDISDWVNNSEFQTATKTLSVPTKVVLSLLLQKQAESIELYLLNVSPS